MGWGDPEAQDWPSNRPPAPYVEVWATPPPPRRIWLHLLLFALTIATTMAVGARFHRNFVQGRPAFEAETDLNPFAGLMQHPEVLLDGIPFSATLLIILSMHELGHMVACRRYGIV